MLVAGIGLVELLRSRVKVYGLRLDAGGRPEASSLISAIKDFRKRAPEGHFAGSVLTRKRYKGWLASKD